MLYYVIFSLVPINALAFSNMKRNCNCPPVTSCPSPLISCPDNSKADISDKKILEKVQLGKMKLNKVIGNKNEGKHVEGEVRPRIYKRFAAPHSLTLEDHADLVSVYKQNEKVSKKLGKQTVLIGTSQDKAYKLAENGVTPKKTKKSAKCNNLDLKNLMLESISDDTSLSKRIINEKGEAKFGGSIDVICSKGHFSYVYSSNLYCEATKGDVSCIAFRQVH